MAHSYQNFPNDTEDSEDEPVRIRLPPTSKVTRWSHIEDLDFFFTKLYTYHQQHGFFCILLRGIFELVEVLFMLITCIFFLYFVDYEVLFGEVPPKSSLYTNNTVKVTIGDVVCNFQRCFGNISALTWLCIALVLLYWFFRVVKLAYNLYHFWDIKAFFNLALQIPDDELINVTWNEVQKKICEAQIEHKMCIRKNELTELDIYHRILRSKNYMVAMVNKSLLPLHHNFPIMGNVAYLSQGLKYNIELLLFSGTWGFFENWHLKEDYKDKNKRLELSEKLKKDITYFAVANFVLCPFIFVWQLLYFFFNYAVLLKREPGVLALRCWSSYGRQYLRHFNELDHELEVRLKRAHRSATKYMNTFSSPVMVIISNSMAFMSGSILLVISLLTIWDEDVLEVQHVLTIMAVLGVIVAVLSGFIPDENTYHCPETLMVEMLVDVHYLPDSWRGQAHTTFVRDQFAQFFQCKATYLLFELISPLMVPYVFFAKLKPRSLEIIDFYRNFTVSVLGVGDVCSFSLMDMRRHGNPAWQASGLLPCPENDRETQAEDGKTELSLIHFAKLNPTWHPPEEAEQFIHAIEEKARGHVDRDGDNDRHSEALESIGLSMISPPCTVERSYMNQLGRFGLEGPMASSSYYFNPTFGNTDSMYRAGRNLTSGSSIVDMRMSTLYLHSLHHKKLMSNTDIASEQHAIEDFSINQGSSTSLMVSRPFRSNSDCVSEGTPLLLNTKMT